MKSNKILGAFLMLMLILITTLWTIVLYLSVIIKILPFAAAKRLARDNANKISELWVMSYIFFINRFLDTRFETDIPTNLSRKEWYLIVSNHQCWLDIVVLQIIFYKKIPFPKFFLKDQLKWVPLLGLAWWLLDFPFMKRHSKQQIEKKPQLKDADLKKTQKNCQIFLKQPTTILNFVEGTRFTSEKHKKKNSPYSNLLPPKAGGLIFTLDSMGDKFNHILDVSITYPHGVKSLWQFLCNETPLVRVKVGETTLPTMQLKKDDKIDKKEFYQWLNQQWQKKDTLLGEMNTLK